MRNIDCETAMLQCFVHNCPIKDLKMICNVNQDLLLNSAQFQIRIKGIIKGCICKLHSIEDVDGCKELPHRGDFKKYQQHRKSGI